MVSPGYNLTKKKLKKIPSELEDSISREVKALLHAHRDTLRNQGWETHKISFSCTEGFYGEAFGIMRCLQILGHGYFGSDNLHALKESEGAGARADGRWITNVNQEIQNLKWWFSQLSDEVLVEEGFRNKTHRCDYCIKKYKKDTATVLALSRGEEVNS